MAGGGTWQGAWVQSIREPRSTGRQTEACLFSHGACLALREPLLPGLVGFWTDLGLMLPQAYLSAGAEAVAGQGYGQLPRASHSLVLWAHA